MLGAVHDHLSPIADFARLSRHGGQGLRISELECPRTGMVGKSLTFVGRSVLTTVTPAQARRSHPALGFENWLRRELSRTVIGHSARTWSADGGPN
jgi:hypothetical protein